MCKCKYCSYDDTDEIKDVLLTKLDLGSLGEFVSTIYVSKLVHNPSIDLLIIEDKSYDKSLVFDSAKINFCPMCGRQLRKELIEDSMEGTEEE